MKTFLLLGALTGLSWLTPKLAQAIGSENMRPIAEYRNEGDAPILFNVACSSDVSVPWTLIQSSDTIRRSIVMQDLFDSPSAAADGVCISSAAAAGDACSSTTPGIQLTANSSYTDYSNVAWYCKGRKNGSVLHHVAGVTFRDKRDYGGIGLPNFQ